MYINCNSSTYDQDAFRMLVRKLINLCKASKYDYPAECNAALQFCVNSRPHNLSMLSLYRRVEQFIVEVILTVTVKHANKLSIKETI